MPSAFTLHEPAPHYPPTLYFGRGGAGNRTHVAPPTSVAQMKNTQVAAAAAHSASHNKPYHTGRGGAGNLRPSGDERRLFSFDEELERDESWRRRLSSEAAASGSGSSASSSGSARVPVYHIGRGGSGNYVHASAMLHDSADSDKKARRGSESSADSGAKKSGAAKGWIKGLSRRA